MQTMFMICCITQNALLLGTLVGNFLEKRAAAASASKTPSGVWNVPIQHRKSNPEEAKSTQEVGGRDYMTAWSLKEKDLQSVCSLWNNLNVCTCIVV